MVVSGNCESSLNCGAYHGLFLVGWLLVPPIPVPALKPGRPVYALYERLRELTFDSDEKGSPGQHRPNGTDTEEGHRLGNECSAGSAGTGGELIFMNREEHLHVFPRWDLYALPSKACASTASGL